MDFLCIPLRRGNVATIKYFDMDKKKEQGQTTANVTELMSRHEQDATQDIKMLQALRKNNVSDLPENDKGVNIEEYQAMTPIERQNLAVMLFGLNDGVLYNDCADTLTNLLFPDFKDFIDTIPEVSYFLGKNDHPAAEQFVNGAKQVCSVVSEIMNNWDTLARLRDLLGNIDNVEYFEKHTPTPEQWSCPTIGSDAN